MFVTELVNPEFLRNLRLKKALWYMALLNETIHPEEQSF